MNKDRPLVSFDWAAKRLLRDKANFEVVEGFLSELFGRDLKITSVLESEGNKVDIYDKFDRVDVVVEDEFKEIILIEMQFSTDQTYFQRMLFGVSKAITDRMHSGDKYGEVKKIYSINIVYFDLGQGDDYVYHCKAFFEGLHRHDILKLSEDQRAMFNKAEPGDLYPEYYVLKLNNFNDLAVTKLDEWIYFLKNNRIEESFSARGLLKARKAMDYAQLSNEEKREYDHVAEARTRHREQIDNAKMIGKIEGKKEGIAKVKAEIVINCKRNGFSVEQIQAITGLDEEKILELLRSNSEE
ncbi:MAG: Rpn family recombination-promoting nuclease/putative transposase [Prevotellaceae bacterium]|jgi:predicted transposase/invertase (TIGR01784 family)|nr:Rpn family recombination-promoting nuclease/putative transposase [Prevotellaceae bacterium]